MKVGIFNVTSGKSKGYIKIYQEILDFNNIPYTLLDYNENFWKNIQEIDYYLHRFIGTDHDIYVATSIIPIIERYLNKKCYPNMNTCWSYEDKIKEFFLMERFNFPMVKSYVFFDEHEALSWSENYKEYPIVFKLKSGASSSNVVKINNKAQAAKVIKKIFGSGIKDQCIPTFGNLKYFNIESMIKHYGVKILSDFGIYKGWPVWNIHKNYAVFQDFLPNNSFDTRIYTIGNRAYAVRRHNRKNDFRSSGSGLIDYDLDRIDLNMVKMALDISKKMGFQSMTYDFLYDKDMKPVFCEFSYTALDKAFYDCKGYWDENMHFVEGNFWPQFLQLKDLLEIDDLKQPQL